MELSRKLVDLIRPEDFRGGPDFRKRVEWLMLLRLMVTTLLLGMTIFFQLRETREFFVHPTIPLYVLIGTIFLLSLIYAFSLPLMPDLWVFSFVQVMVDVIYATVLIHFTGGASSVFTLLYMFPIITSGILHLRRGALVTASVAAISFGVLVNLEFYDLIPHSVWPWVSPLSRNTPGYLLWVLVVHFTFFFLMAFLSSSLAEQLQKAKTSLNLTEIDYKQLSELHTNIVRSIPSGIITTDEFDHITFINNSGAAFLGTSFASMVNTPLIAVFPFIDDGNAVSNVRRESFLTVKEINGETKHLELTVSDLKGQDAIPRGRLVVFQDVTQIRKMEERVKLSEKQAAYVRIAAGMAHEIRNPLAAIRGATELLTQTPSVSELEKRLMGIVIKESDRLNSLLGDFLLTVGSQQPSKARIMLTDVVEETLRLFSQDEQRSRGLKLETMINKGVEVEGDRTRLRQAMWNLLANALEAAPDNDVIRVILETDQDTNSAVFRVHDWGCGIPPELMTRIFEPFTTTKEKGTGLGLSVVLSVVQAHNGTVEVESTSGTGTMFTVKIPLAPAEVGAGGAIDNG
ncbi:MAG TPA: ATP-binding protein [Desulfomonilaceae bacterium]|nr:ATP-binding protein [Desulfomonilaceae bacterium]